LAGDIVVSVAEDQKAHAKVPSSQSQLAEDTIEYECYICADDFPFSAGVAHCEEHFTCNCCVVVERQSSSKDATFVHF
jgi:hypothetical protein